MVYYYYLVASLPTLEFGANPPLTTEEFLSQCVQHLSRPDLSVIQKIIQQEKADTDMKNIFFKQWEGFNHNIRNEMAYFRARRAGKDPAVYVRGERSTDPLYAELVAEASKGNDPLATEKIFDRRRWQFLDDQVRFHYFDLDILMVYALKLKILERYQAIASAKGKAIFLEYKNINISLN